MLIKYIIIIHSPSVLEEPHLVIRRAFPQRHNSRHLLLGDLDLPAAERILIDVTHAEIREAPIRLLDLLPRRDVVVVG